jgi:YHS domain-containing protein
MKFRRNAMTDVRNTVTVYLDAVYGGDITTARRYLGDRFSFIGPAAQFSDPDRFLRATEHAARAVRKLETHKVFVDGQDACIFYDLHLDHGVQVVPVAEWYHLEGGRIASIRTILDTAPFTATREGATETAVDPVCSMSVDKSSAPARREHSSATYYFCSAACAESFDRDPERFLETA